MFRLAASQIRSWWSAGTADILGADLPPELGSRHPEPPELESRHPEPPELESRHPEPPELESRYPHSERPPLRLRRARRPGAVPRRPVVCISPVRTRQS